jgi:hypothetical protein
MANLKIQVGQVWRKAETEQNFLVTRLYTEALSTYAVLRPTGSENSAILKVKVERTSDGQTLPGFSIAHIMDSQT